MALSRNVFCTGTSSIRMAWTLSLKYLTVKTPVVDEKRLVFRGESQLGKSFKITV